MEVTHVRSYTKPLRRGWGMLEFTAAATAPNGGQTLDADKLTLRATTVTDLATAGRVGSADTGVKEQ
jgi:hypothetical protein